MIGLYFLHYWYTYLVVDFSLYSIIYFCFTCFYRYY